MSKNKREKNSEVFFTNTIRPLPYSFRVEVPHSYRMEVKKQLEDSLAKHIRIM